jgi:hypothetical protein
VEKGPPFVMAAVVPRGEGSGMSAILELVLEFVINLAGCVLEVWLGDFGSRGRSPHLIFWSVVVVLLGIVILWEVR